MNFSPGKARRKWPFSKSACGETAKMVTGVTLLLVICAAYDPASAARRRATGLLPFWGGLFGERATKPRRAALHATVPLPKPRPADAPAIESEQPAVVNRSPAEGAAPVPKPRPADAPATKSEQPAEREQPAAPPPPSACRLALSEEIAIAPSIPDIHGPGGCGGEDLVRLEAVVLPDKHRVALKPAATLRCTMASAIADWVRTDMAPLAASLGSEISDLDNFDSFECRGRNRVAGAQLSEHGRANALDVRGVKLADGRSISLTDREVPRDTRETILHSVCARFMTVLGPGSDGYHEDHIHLDLMERHNNYKICQWNVWDPLPQVAPLLPAARPEEAPPREVAAKADTDKTDADKADAAKSDGAKPASPRAAGPKRRGANKKSAGKTGAS
ncbi:Uncharacterized conserved protein [Bradyrhizobium erythrophlei]|uniref:Uncharacterized conserved protein n=2 Tax=Bradyrhizobium erythrophlei TaxID=1437360 RepID=A0A1M5V7Y0_9BRAD|nr:extensin family protein [Bradyrhizobium erythrophlei]SHH71325.1 Uncharacterized conserved protein [Bradyrhizobium erythrophlei]